MARVVISSVPYKWKAALFGEKLLANYSAYLTLQSTTEVQIETMSQQEDHSFQHPLTFKILGQWTNFYVTVTYFHIFFIGKPYFESIGHRRLILYMKVTQVNIYLFARDAVKWTK